MSENKSKKFIIYTVLIGLMHSSHILRTILRKKMSISLENHHQWLKSFLIFSSTVLLLLSISSNSAIAIQEASSGFTWPLPYAFSNNGGYIFLQDATYSGGTVKHPGEDWNVPNSPGGSRDGDKGLDVVSVADGEVVYANTSTWGGIVVKHIYNGQTWYSQYGHIQNAVVSKGDNAYKGHKIAEIGNVGTQYAHLHFEIRQSDHPNPTYGPYWSYGSGGLANIDNVNNWYKDPDTFILAHPAYSGSGNTGKPDLVVKEVNLSKRTLAPGESFHIDTQIRNDGVADVSSSFKIKYLLSNGTGIDSSPSSLAEDSISSLGKGDSKWEDATVTAPTNPGTYNISVRADSSTDIDESNEGNNYFDPPVVITVQNSSEPPVVTTPNIPPLMAIMYNLILDDDYQVTYSVTGGNGSITCVPTVVASGGNSICFISPAAGYYLSTFTDNTADKLYSVTPDSYTISNVVTNHSISGMFAPEPINGACGSSNGGTFTILQSSNLCSTGTTSAVIGSGPWNWSCTGLNAGTTASCSANIQTFAVTFVNGGNGTLTGTTSQTVNYNASATAVTANPAPGYYFVNWTGTGGFVTTSNPLTVASVMAAQTITANFSPISSVTFTVTPSAGINGSLSPSTAQTVNSGATTSLTVSPATGYQIAAVTGCGGTLSGTTYSTGAITGNCIVSVAFSAISSQIPTRDGIINTASSKTTPDISDALSLLKHVVGLTPLSSVQLTHADVAPLGFDGKPFGNGIIDAADVILILRRSIGIGSW